MNIHMTLINGIGGTAGMGQQKIMQIGHELGCKEMGLYHYNVDSDSFEGLNCRVDGIIASLKHDDIVFLQYPTWNKIRFEYNLADHIRAYQAKLIIFVEDVKCLMWNGSVIDDVIREEIEFFNKADLLILPSPRMHDFFKAHGLKVRNVLYQTIWDYPMEDICTEHRLIRRLYFPGGHDRFPFIQNYKGQTTIYNYSMARPHADDAHLVWRGFMKQNDLIREMSEGGFGLVWSDPSYFDQYYCMNQSYKLATYLAAGIPVIVQKGAAYAAFVEDHHLGFVLEDLADADAIIQSMTEQQYKVLTGNVRYIQYLVTRGHYTRSLLIDAVGKVLEGSCQPIE